MFRQSLFGRVAGYEDVNDAGRLSCDPVMRLIASGRNFDRFAASKSQMGRFETNTLTAFNNLTASPLPHQCDYGRITRRCRIAFGAQHNCQQSSQTLPKAGTNTQKVRHRIASLENGGQYAAAQHQLFPSGGYRNRVDEADLLIANRNLYHTNIRFEAVINVCETMSIRATIKTIIYDLYRATFIRDCSAAPKIKGQQGWQNTPESVAKCARNTHSSIPKRHYACKKTERNLWHSSTSLPALAEYPH